MSKFLIAFVFFRLEFGKTGEMGDSFDSPNTGENNPRDELPLQVLVSCTYSSFEN